ncbi:MAG: twin-arginine translocase subunit TatC [Pseudomonadota bacterium]
MSTDSTESPEPAQSTATKSFWGHLDDLRSALIRSAMAIGVALVLCIFFAHRIVEILEYPLRHIDMFEKPKPTVSFKIGGTKLGPYVVSRDQFPGLPPGDAPHVVYQFGSAPMGQEQVATLKVVDEPGPVDSLNVQLHNYGPIEGFAVAFHVAIYGALVLSAPFWIYFIGSFILPALNMRERQNIMPWASWSLVLFLFGVLSTYFFLLPVALRASVEYSQLLGFNGTEWRADDYINFVTRFILGMGLGFQFPIVVLLLVKMGILTYKQLAYYRRHVCVLSFFLGAVLTTPEVITQVAMAVPMYLLYEICIWIAWYWDRKKRRAGGIVDV